MVSGIFILKLSSWADGLVSTPSAHGKPRFGARSQRHRPLPYCRFWPFDRFERLIFFAFVSFGKQRAHNIGFNSFLRREGILKSIL